MIIIIQKSDVFKIHRFFYDITVYFLLLTSVYFTQLNRCATIIFINLVLSWYKKCLDKVFFPYFR